MPWYLYIAESSKGKYYVGISTDVEKRIEVHSAGKGSVMGRIEGPFKLVYKSRELKNRSEATKREIEVKGWDRAKKRRLIDGELTL